MTNYKKDDWVFYNFRLVQIKEIEEGKITQISDGFFSTHGLDLGKNVVPLTVRNKCISDEIKAVYYDDLYRMKGTRHLNWPEIHSKLVDLWLALCKTKKKEISYNRIYDFRDKVVAAAEEANNITVEGINLLRQ